MSAAKTHQGYANPAPLYFGDETQWQECFNYLKALSNGAKNKTPFFLLLGEKHLGKKQCFDKICHELASEKIPFQASDPIDMLDRDKDITAVLEPLKKDHPTLPHLDAVSLSLGVPVLNFFKVALTYKKDLSSAAVSSPSAPEKYTGKYATMQRLLDASSEDELLLLHIAHFEEAYLNWFTLLDEYLRRTRSEKKRVVVFASCDRNAIPRPILEDSQIARFLEDLGNAGLIKKITFAPMNESELKTRIDARFSPNTFPSQFYKRLFAATGGRAGLLSDIVSKLLEPEKTPGAARYWDPFLNQEAASESWTLHDNWETVLSPDLPDSVLDPIEQTLAEQQLRTPLSTVKKFLSIGALVGEVFPVAPVLQTLRLSERFDEDELIDLIDGTCVELKTKALEDLGFKDHLFTTPNENMAAYRFTSPFIHSYFLNRAHDEKIGWGKTLAAVLEEAFVPIPQALWRTLRNLHRAAGDIAKADRYQSKIDLDLTEATFSLFSSELNRQIIGDVPLSKTPHFQSLLERVQLNRRKWHAETLLGLLELLLKHAAPDDDHVLYGDILFLMSDAQLTLGDAISAQQSAEAALEHVRIAGHRHAEGVVLSTIGNIHEHNDQLAQALLLYNEALNIHRERGNQSQEGAVLCDIGIIYKRRGDLQQAMSLYKEALYIHRERGNRDQEGVVLSEIGDIHKRRGKFEKAMPLYEEALVIHRDTKNRRQEGIALSDIGDIHERLGELQQALAFYNEGLECLEEVGDKRNQEMVSERINALQNKTHR